MFGNPRHIPPLLGILAMLATSCANVGDPDGGPYDETPPHVVGASPAEGAVNNKNTTIVIYFDEFIKL